VKLEVEGLTFTHDHSRYQLRDVSLTVGSGQVCCLLGPNGTGKTTLLRCLLGLLTPEAGTVLLDGEPIRDLSARALARLVAYVPQSMSTPFPFTTLDIAVMGRTPHLSVTSSPSRADRRLAARALEQVGIGHLADRSFTSLSGGERQLALFARALTQEAELLILDEPTAALDYGNEVRVLHLIRDLGRSGRTIVMSTHQPDHPLRYGDQAVLLDGGRVVADGPPADVVTGDLLSEVYQVRVYVLPTGLLDDEGREMYTCLAVRASENTDRTSENTVQAGENTVQSDENTGRASESEQAAGGSRPG
jgi:iron complex transport system ATP-binding protein